MLDLLLLARKRKPALPQYPVTAYADFLGYIQSMGYTVVQPGGNFVSIDVPIGNSIARQVTLSTTRTGGFYGSSWQDRFTYDSTFGRVIGHAFPTLAAATDNMQNARVVTVQCTYLGDQPSYNAVNRNNDLSSSWTNYRGWEMTEMLYWDESLQLAMRINPKLGGDPTPLNAPPYTVGPGMTYSDFNRYMTAKSIPVESMGTTVQEKTGYFRVALTTNPSGTMYGTPYNAAVTQDSNIGRIASHALPDTASFNENFVNKRTVLMKREFQGNLPSYPSVTRGGYTSAAYGAYPGVFITDLVYWDDASQRVLRYNPHLVTSPVQFDGNLI